MRALCPHRHPYSRCPLECWAYSGRPCWCGANLERSDPCAPIGRIPVHRPTPAPPRRWKWRAPPLPALGWAPPEGAPRARPLASPCQCFPFEICPSRLVRPSRPTHGPDWARWRPCHLPPVVHVDPLKRFLVHHVWTFLLSHPLTKALRQCPCIEFLLSDLVQRSPIPGGCLREHRPSPPGTWSSALPGNLFGRQNPCWRRRRRMIPPQIPRRTRSYQS
mmetsp:Transcript_25458/g.48117  ORF Transcript_25458/g.48117 Transcript_25458/m.48117 type:complete len:219 (-) Transcript_25458:566-1222(-)